MHQSTTTPNIKQYPCDKSVRAIAHLNLVIRVRPPQWSQPYSRRTRMTNLLLASCDGAVVGEE